MSNTVEKLRRNYLDVGYDGLHITGVMMQYLKLCKREVWFEANDIPIDKSNEYIVHGDTVDETTFEKHSETIRIGGMIAPDLLEDGRIVEVKPSSKITTGAKAQLKYYLWVFNEILQENKDGVLAIPTERERIQISYTKDVKREVEENIEEIKKIIDQESPPPLEKKNICSNCAFQDFCWVAETDGDTDG